MDVLSPNTAINETGVDLNANGQLAVEKPPEPVVPVATLPVFQADFHVPTKLSKKLQDAFSVFQESEKEFVHARNIGTILRSLNLYLTEKDVNQVTQLMDEKEATGQIKFDRFSIIAAQLILDTNRQRDDEEVLRRAFRSLDRDKKGFLTSEELRVALTSAGEPMSQEEIEEMLTVCVDPIEGKILYDDYARKLALP